jgi:hypothetical protein
MDIGVLLARTEFFIALDVDAFPIGEQWLDRMLDPLRDGSAQVSGVQTNERPYVHPCGLAMRVQKFVDMKHTFRANWAEEGLGDTHWDVGELISMREQPAVHMIPCTERIGPGAVGSSMATSGATTR